MGRGWGEGGGGSMGEGEGRGWKRGRGRRVGGRGPQLRGITSASRRWAWAAIARSEEESHSETAERACGSALTW